MPTVSNMVVYSYPVRFRYMIIFRHGSERPHQSVFDTRQEIRWIGRRRRPGASGFIRTLAEDTLSVWGTTHGRGGGGGSRRTSRRGRRLMTVLCKVQKKVVHFGFGTFAGIMEIGVRRNSSPWDWKGASPTLQSERNTLSIPGGLRARQTFIHWMPLSDRRCRW